MQFRHSFPMTSWILRTFTGRIALRVYFVLVLSLVATSATARIYTLALTRRMEVVIAGLSKLEIDKSTEEEVKRTVPYLVRWQWQVPLKRSPENGDIDIGVEQGYSVAISNESSWMKFGRLISPFTSCCLNTTYTKDGYEQNWILALTNLLGYRYVYFGASVVLLNGRVSSISYGVQDRLVFPRQVGMILDVKSVHAFWASYRRGFEVSSMDDESPQFRVRQGTSNLSVSFTFDAPPDLVAHAFDVDLSCLWGIRGCLTPANIAPALAQDAERIQSAALTRLKSTDPCPARIVAGRSKYLTDVSVSLIQSEGLRREPINREGSLGIRTVTDYKLTEVLRGFPVQSLKSVEVRSWVPFPGDYTKQLPNPGPQWPERGKQILLFSNHSFDSCQLVPAAPEAIAVVRNTRPTPKRAEDQTGLRLH
jgi:hypothetical protein